MKYEHMVDNPDIIKPGLFLKKLIGNKEPVFVCIGTDRSTGDSLGPLVGDKLQKLGYKVYGTIDSPIHAENLRKFIEHLNVPDDTIIVAIDASLTYEENRIGMIKIEDNSIKPGAGFGKELPEIGEISITGIVNLGGYMEYFILQSTRLSFVMKLAKRIVQIISYALEMSEEYISEGIAV